jgi:hypothetical protein
MPADKMNGIQTAEKAGTLTSGWPQGHFKKFAIWLPRVKHK